MTALANPWLQFLQQQGAEVDAAGDVIRFRAGSPEAPAALSSGFVAPLTHLGLISASGEDMSTFLHNQLTSDVQNLANDRAVLAAYCSAKGRMLASFLLWRAEDAVLLQLPRDTQASVQKRLQMFVLRSKVKLLDVSPSTVSLGIVGETAASALAKSTGSALPAQVYQKEQVSSGSVIRVPDADGMPRYQWVTDSDSAIRAWPELTAAVTPASSAAWRLMEIHAALPAVVQATQEKFVPQMINFELIGGVNFRKGCYPGQEIVARSQYLGKLKRRMVLARINATGVAPGMEVFASTDPDQPCGQIVNAELASEPGIDALAAMAGNNGITDCLVELKTAALDEGTIHLGSAGGPQLSMLNLPYPLTEPA